MAKEAPDELAAVEAAATEAPDLRLMALQCAEDSAGNVTDAAIRFIEILKSGFQDVYEERASRAMQLWAESFVREAASRVRRSISYGSKTSGTPSMAALSPHADRNFALCWMNWQVAPGIQLCDATRPQLLKASEFYLASAATQAARGNWLAAVADKLKDDKTTVGSKLAEKDVAKMAAEFKVSKE